MTDRAGVVSVDLEPNLPALGSRIEGFARNLKPLGLRFDIPEFAQGVESQAGRSRRAVDSISTDKAQGQFRTLGDTADRELGRIDSRLRLSSQGLMAVGAGGIYAGTRILGALRPATEAASDLNEAVSYAGVVFGDAADEIDAFASGAADRLGQSKRQATEAATTFATFGKAAGLAGDDLVKFSTDLVQLSTDMASARNTTPADAITAIGAALRGETEPIRAYGVLLDDATTRQEALSLGIVKTTKDALTPQQRVLAVQSLLFKQTTDAQGDFARTADSAANAQKRAAAAAEDAKAALGEGLTPVVAGAAKTVTLLLNTLDKIPGATTAVGIGLAGLGGAAILGGAVSSVLGGVKAIQEFRLGFATAGATAVAANEAIAATSTQAAVATAGVAASYDAVAASAARAAAASAGASAGGWQYARPRTVGALGAGTGAVIDVASREATSGMRALESGLTRTTSTVAASTGTFSRWGTAVGSAAAGARSAVNGVGLLNAGLISATVSAAGFGFAWSELKRQTERGVDQFTDNANKIRAAFDPENPAKFGFEVEKVARAVAEVDSVGDFDAWDIINPFDDDSEDRANVARKQIEELGEAFEGLSTAQARDFLGALTPRLIAYGFSAEEAEEITSKLYDQLDERDAIERATGAIDNLTTGVEALGVKIDPTASKWEKFSTILGGIFDPVQNALSAQQALADGQETLAEAQRKYEDIVNGNTEGLRSAAEALSEARDDLAAATAETGPGSRAARDAAQDVRDALRAYRDLEIEAGKTREGDFFEDRTEDLLAARDRIVEAQENLSRIESSDTDEVRNARDRLADAQARYNEELAQTGPNSEAARDALKEVEDAQARIIPLMVSQEQAAAALREQLEAHPEAIQASIAQVDAWLAKGLVSVGVAQQWKIELLEAASAAKGLADTLTPPDYEAAAEWWKTGGGMNKPKPKSTGSETTTVYGPGGAPSFGLYPYVGGRASGGPVAARSMAEVVERGEPEMLHAGGRSYLLTGSQGGTVTPLGSSGVADEIRGLRGDISGLTAFLMRQASVGGGGELLAPILMEIAHLLRSSGAGRSPGDTRAMALEFA